MFLKIMDLRRLFISKGRSYICPRAVWMIFTVSLLLSFNVVHAVEISDNPMETQVQSAAANIMFVLDDSGSMDWEFMTGSTDGKFEGDIEYLFDDPGGDNNYPTSDGSGTILTGSNRGKWKSQWSGYNKVFYDPSTVYLPWPNSSDHSFANANISTPRSNPVDTTPTFDIRSEYHSVDNYTGAIIVDNQDAGTFTTTGSWNESGATDEYDGSSFYTQNEDDTATWTPNLASAGTYNVYAWWCYYDTRDTYALYTVNHTSGSDTMRVNQQQDTGQWVLLGTYDFNAGTSGSVTVTRDNQSTQDSTSADAVMFVPSGLGPPVISIKRAHYYTWHDADDNGELDSGENVYLVNFIDSDSDNVLDSRKYYKLNDTDSDDVAESGELTDVTDTAEPDFIKPIVYREDGTFDRYKTSGEDLQNFANWYQYYRRRELTAKAVVANSINGMEGVSIGLYSINQGVVQEVLPVRLDMAASVIVDNQDAGFSVNSGSDWNTSGADDYYDDDSYYTEDQDAWAKWTPDLPSDGEYEVYAWWCYYDTRDTYALYTVNYDGGSAPHRIDQTQNAGQWVLLGTYDFQAGTAGDVTVTRDSQSTGTSTSADAVMFVATFESNEDKTGTVLDLLYEMDSDGLTPLRQALEQVGKYYDQSAASTIGTSPFGDEVGGGACQKAYAIVMTDGYYNQNPPSVGDADGDQGEPYADDPDGDSDYSNTLADVAMYYYKTDLSSTLPNVVPTKGCDTADHQHMTTYTLSFGVTGTIDLEDMDGDGLPDTTTYAEDPCFDNASTPVPTWPNPADGNSEKIDDLFHAAVNGRGLFFSASNPRELVESMAEIVSDIRDPASGASVSVNGEELGADTVLYQARYMSGDWIGEVLAFPINQTTGAVENGPNDILWNSADKLERVAVTWDNRRIVTYNGADVGTKFRWSSLTTAQQDALKEADWSPAPSQEAHAEGILEYIRGSSDIPADWGFRYRTKKLGDIVHSAPVLVGKAISAMSDGLDNDDDGFADSLDPDGEREGGTIFVGGNDGMVHAFNAQNGWERFAYVPNLVFENLKYLKESNFIHRFYVDMTPYFKEIQISDTERKTYLVGGLGKGGKGYYMLKIRDRVWNSGTYTWDDNMNVDNFDDTTSENDLITAQLVQWEYPRADTANDGMDNDGDADTDEVGETDPDIGYSFSQAYVVKTNDPNNEWVVIFGNGYNSVANKAVLYILDLNGVIVRKIDTGVSGDNGLSTPALIDVNNDQKLDYVYAGDLKGNMWKFDLTADTAANWDIAFNDGTDPQPLFAAGQPITAKPDIMRHCGYGRHGYMVVFGTGKYLHNDDRMDFSQQTIYGIWDYGDDADDDEYVGSALNHSTGQIGSPGPDIAGTYLLKQTVVDIRDITGHGTFRTFSDNTAEWNMQTDADTDEKPNPTNHVGWFIDFPNASPYEGERVFKSVQIRDGKVFVISFFPDSSPCSGGGNSWLYIFDACDGGRMPVTNPQFEIGVAEGTVQVGTDAEGNPIYAEKNTVQIGTDAEGKPITAPPTGKLFVGTLHEPKIIRKPGTGLERLYMSSSTGVVETEDVPAERRGTLYWLER